LTTPQPLVPPPTARLPTLLPPARAAAVNATLTVAFLLVAVITLVAGLNLVDPRTFAGARPTGATDTVLVRAAVAGLRDCAQATSFRPPNCPQVYSPSDTSIAPGDAQDVHWSLHRGNNQFLVHGTFVMVVTWSQQYGGPGRGLVAAGYTAITSWTRGTASLINLGRGYQTVPVPRPPGAMDATLLAAARHMIRGCARRTPASWPAYCPELVSNISSDSTAITATWAGDPTVGARISYHSDTGLFHITGSYRANFAWTGSSDRQTDTGSGNYDLAMAWTDGKPDPARFTTG
jgi:hypothetical protein